MEVHPITYLYIILALSNFLFAVLSVLKRNYEKFGVSLICLGMFSIGIFVNVKRCLDSICMAGAQ